MKFSSIVSLTIFCVLVVVLPHFLPDLLGITAVIAYSYMAAVAFIQPPIMKLLTTKSERNIIMQESGPVNNKLKILFPNIAMFLIILIVPRSAPLISMFMIGNILKESQVVPRLVDAASNELINLSTIFLMITIGTQLNGPKVINVETLLILGLGLVAFAVGSASGIILAKIMNLFLKQKINPLIGSAGVSAVPMSARISHHMGQEENPNNYLLSHAMGPNVAGVIGSAVIAGLFLAFEIVFPKPIAVIFSLLITILLPGAFQGLLIMMKVKPLFVPQ